MARFGVLMLKVCAVTVTYGQRAGLVHEMVEGALQSGVDEVFIVDNGSDKENADQLFSTFRDKKNIFIKRYDENYGSAGGFNRALKWAREESSCDFIWVLDDDNVPEPEALSALLFLYSYLGKDPKNVLVSYRMIMSSLSNSVEHKQPLLESIATGRIVGERSSLKKRLFGAFLLRSRAKLVERYPVVPRKRASWGGMFISKEAFDIVGYPNEDFYLYADDFEFSDRLTKQGFSIYTASRSVIIDIDAQPGASGYFSADQPGFKVYYSLRNHAYLDHRNDLFWGGIFVFSVTILGLLKVGPRPIYFKRLALIYRAIKDGVLGNLGKNSF